MSIISEYIHEIVVAAIFVLAVTFLVLLSGSGEKLRRSIDNQTFNKLNVSETTENSGSALVNGSAVYYDIANIITSEDGVACTIKTSDHSITVNNNASIVRELEEQGSSATLMDKIDMNGTYHKKNVPNTDGTKIAQVIYEKD